MKPVTRRSIFDRLVGLPARALLALIAIYQRTLSPVLPALCGAGCGCRFAPTCSHYAAGAVRAHGVLTGAWLAACRLAKCTPWHPGGFDPVPASPALPSSRPTRHQSPRCGRVNAAPLATRLSPLA